MKKSWFDIVIEKQMSVGDALAFMGLNNNVLKTDIDKRYKELSKKYHPDLGGNPEDMKTLNQARDILSKVRFSTNMDTDVKEKYKMERNAVEKFSMDYLELLNPRPLNRSMKRVMKKLYSILSHHTLLLTISQRQRI